MALGGVAMGSMKAYEQAIVAGIMRRSGCRSNERATCGKREKTNECPALKQKVRAGTYENFSCHEEKRTAEMHDRIFRKWSGCQTFSGHLEGERGLLAPFWGPSLFLATSARRESDSGTPATCQSITTGLLWGCLQIDAILPRALHAVKGVRAQILARRLDFPFRSSVSQESISHLLPEAATKLRREDTDISFADWTRALRYLHQSDESFHCLVICPECICTDRPPVAWCCLLGHTTLRLVLLYGYLIQQEEKATAHSNENDGF
jgi:hypothetical protein